MYEFWVSRWELLAADAPYLASALAAVAVIIIVFNTIFRIRWRKVLTPPRIALVAGTIALAIFLIYLTAPERMGFAVVGGKLVVNVGWWGAPYGREYSLSDCALEWVNSSSAHVMRIGYGGARAAVGWLMVSGPGVKAEGYGIFVRGAEWILIARCPDGTYVLGAPGLSPEAARD